MVSTPIVGVGMLTESVAVVESDWYLFVASCVAVIVVVPFVTTVTSFSGRIDIPVTQF